MVSIRELAHEFSRQVRDKGLEYFREGRVSLIRGTNHSAYARVRGAEVYVSEVQWDEGGITDALCTCPWFEDRQELCKHIWATLLEAEQVGHLGGVKKKSVEMLPEWKRQIEQVRRRMEQEQQLGVERAVAEWPGDRRINYIIDVPATFEEGEGFVVELATERLKDGVWERPKRAQHSWEEWMAVPDEGDRAALQMLLGARDQWEYGYRAERMIALPWGAAGETIVRAMCRTGRCKVRVDDREVPTVVGWDEGGAWGFRVKMAEGADGEMRVTGGLARGAEEMAVNEATIILRTGMMIARGRVARMEHGGAFDLLAVLKDSGGLSVPRGEAWGMVEEMYRLPRPPAMELPAELRVEELRPVMKPVLKVKTVKNAADRLVGEMMYDYAGQMVTPGEKGGVLFDTEKRRVIRRDMPAEAGAWQRLMRAGFKLEWDYGLKRQALGVAASKFAKGVRELVAEGWVVEAEGTVWRTAGPAPTVNVASGIDWFELDAKVDFGAGQEVGLPRLLAAVKKGEGTIRLDDGSVGVVPEEWLRKYAPLAGLGEEREGKLRFTSTQVGFLDALVASAPGARWDEGFGKARERLERLERFEGVGSVEPPAGFVGELRPYQKEGLGWLGFLQDFGFGGCLADDMGLGKTIQILAMLAGRRGKGPSLVVAPRSLVFNWAREAERFVPGLKVLDHSPAGRKRAGEAVEGYDLVLATYGTIRRDAGYLKDVKFDYVVLDESQAIKNSSTASAKACKLLKANHRLALSGTPIENHLGELWSLLEFLNPGMLGTASAFKQWAGGATSGDVGARQTLAKAVRPFVFRRTKKEVAKDLPERTEQTIWCEMEAGQRKLYDELRDHYRKSLLLKVENEGMGRAKIEILEALLRLRQAACHPGLIDPQHAELPSAKFEALFSNLEEVLEEGHKVLVFSQFTSLLGMVRKELDARKVAYEYLDGQTTDRQARVDRFQNTPELKVFLISLKAGGVGLNLTAADYVYLLDPWWNPAAEAQAIDRAHRIGQRRSVFAYRLIAKGTVEEKVLELQRGKRELAEAIITADNALISKLGREELDHLLS